MISFVAVDVPLYVIVVFGSEELEGNGGEARKIEEEEVEREIERKVESVSERERG